MEVNHGPALLDNNICLSDNSLLVNSQGAAYVHNLFAGRFRVIIGERRLTPHLVNHGTEMAGLAPNPSGDERFYNNLLVGEADLSTYNNAVLPVWMDGNVYLNGATPGKAEPYPLHLPGVNPVLELSEKDGEWTLKVELPDDISSIQARKLITTDLLGTVAVPNLPFVQPDDTPYEIDYDYLGSKRNSKNPYPGPLKMGDQNEQEIVVWKKITK